MLSTLLNRPMTILRRTASGTTDAYGADIPGTTEVEVVGELQQQRRDEPATEGELSDTRWLAIFPAGTSIDTGDAVACDGETFEVVGDPWAARNPRTQVVSHVEATLRRTATAGDET